MSDQKPVIVFINRTDFHFTEYTKPESIKAAFANMGHEAIVLGGNDQDLSLKELGDTIAKLHKEGKSFTVFLDTHGKVKNNDHYMSIGDEFDVDALLADIKKKHPEVKDFDVTIQHGKETSAAYDKKLGFDTTKPMDLEGAKSVVAKLRGIKIGDVNTRDEEDGFQMPYGDPGIFGIDDKPVAVNIKVPGTDTTYKVPFVRAVKTEDIFRTVEDNAKGTKHSYFSAACESGGASGDFNAIAPKGTVFVGISSGYAPGLQTDLEAMMRTMQRYDNKDKKEIPLNAQNLLGMYLRYGIRAEQENQMIPPMIAVAGEGIVDLDKGLEAYIADNKGKKFLLDDVYKKGSITIKSKDGKHDITMDMLPKWHENSNDFDVPEGKKDIGFKYGPALLAAMAAKPEYNESYEQLQAHRDFYRALQPKFEGDRAALIESALAAGIQPNNVSRRSDGGIFGHYTSYDDVMKMAIQTDDPKVVALMIDKGKVALKEDHLLQAAELGNKDMVDMVLAKGGNDIIKEKPEFARYMLARAINAKDLPMYDHLKEKGFTPSKEASTLGLIFWPSEGTGELYDESKHLPMLKHLVEKEGFSTIGMAHSRSSGEIPFVHYAANVDDETFLYVLERAHKESGKSKRELLMTDAYDAGARNRKLAHQIASFGTPKAMGVIIDEVPEFREKRIDHDSSPPLKAAVTFANLETAEALLNRHADIDAQIGGPSDNPKSNILHEMLGGIYDNKDGRTKIVPMINLLAKHGVDVFAPAPARIQRGFNARQMDISYFAENELGEEAGKAVKEAQEKALVLGRKYAKETEGRDYGDIVKMFDQGELKYTDAEIRTLWHVGNHHDVHKDVAYTLDQTRALKTERDIRIRSIDIRDVPNKRDLAKAYGEIGEASWYGSPRTTEENDAPGGTIELDTKNDLERIAKVAKTPKEEAALIGMHIQNVTNNLQADGRLGPNDLKIIGAFKQAAEQVGR